jgi:hypothetical protein
MDDNDETRTYGLDEEAQKGQPQITEYYNKARFKGAQLPSKTSSSLKTSASASHSQRHPASEAPVDACAGAGANVSAPGQLLAEEVLPTQQTLEKRMSRAQALEEPKLEDVCCLKVPTHRRSVGVSCRGLSAEAESKAGSLLPHTASLAVASHAKEDWTQLNAAGAAEVVEMAARLFCKVGFQPRMLGCDY